MGCPITTTDPWRTRDAPASPMSFVAGLLIVAIGVAGVWIGRRPGAAWAILAGLGALAVVCMVVLAVRGHRGWCIVRRGLWYAVAIPGLPIRMLAFLG